jgi:hypothetical protein
MSLFESGFDKFWSAWPKHPRKGAKSKCQQVWNKSYCESCADQILKHIAWMLTTDQWRKDGGAFIPAPLVYLNQQRWDGAEIPESFGKKPEQIIDPALVKIQQDRAKAVGIPDHIREKMRQICKI